MAGNENRNATETTQNLKKKWKIKLKIQNKIQSMM